ncbi:MAG: UDP-glucose/GDP-mannose dehydrogenase family protein [Thermoplasmata archaeon]|nr:UDP-glucose/GDP-mannose dehydrogenase family protein [Thermoplasmata archaeon]
MRIIPPRHVPGGTIERIGIVGSGYVGLATAVTLGKLGHEIICLDILPDKVDAINSGKSPLDEPGIDEALAELTSAGKLKATLAPGELTECDIIFLCVDTPQDEHGHMDTEALDRAVYTIGHYLAEGQLIVVKSTVIPGTTRNAIGQSIALIAQGKKFGLCHNPEFLREGNALADSMNPDRIVIGAMDEASGARLEKLYDHFDCPKLIVEPETSELIKYASNVFLAMKITYANEMANISEQFGVDVEKVMEGVKLDKRISPHFLQAGAGFGGSCFDKDLRAIASASEQGGYFPTLLRAVLLTNEVQPLRTIQLLDAAMDTLEGKRIAVLGLAFKENSGDVRNTRAAPIVSELAARNADIILYDPMAMDNFKELGYENYAYAASAEEALKGADAVIVQTRWDEFSNIAPEKFKELMNRPVIIDGRRTFVPEEMLAAGIIYVGIGWKNTFPMC